MATSFDDHVVSPELALVDADLAVRARLWDQAETTPLPTTRVRPPTASAVVSRAPRAATRRRRRSTLVAGSLVLLAALVAAGARPATTPSPTPLAVVAERSVAVVPTAPTSGTVPPSLATSTPSPPGERQAPATTPAAAIAPAPLPSEAGLERLPPAATLSWTAASHATSYELELVRSGRVILRRSANAPTVHVPRAWTSAGATYRLRPEDQAYVWSVVGGRREERPLVDGVLALDLMLGPLGAPAGPPSG
jgi:hypothetical protein